MVFGRVERVFVVVIMGKGMMEGKILVLLPFLAGCLLLPVVGFFVLSVVVAVVALGLIVVAIVLLIALG